MGIHRGFLIFLFCMLVWIQFCFASITIMADDLAQRVADLRAYRQSLREPYTDMDVTQQSYPNTAADRQREVKRYPYGYAQRDKSRNGLWEEPLESETERDKGDKKDDDDAASTAHSIEDVFDQWLGNLGVAEVSSADIAVHTVS